MMIEVHQAKETPELLHSSEVGKVPHNSNIGRKGQMLE